MPRIGTSAAGGSRAVKPRSNNTTRKPTKFDHTNFTQAIKSAQRTGKPLVVKVGASWCGPCQAMNRNVFGKEDIQKRLGKDATFVSVEVDRAGDTRQQKEAAKKISEKLGTRSYPTVFIATLENKNGKAVPKIIKKAHSLNVEKFNQFLNDPQNGLKAAAKGIKNAGFGPGPTQ